MEILEPLFDRNLDCHMCRHKFTSKKLRSKFVKVDSYDTDFCPSYKEEEINGLLYNIYVCPRCGFSFSDDFSKYFPPGTKDEIQTKICDQWSSQDFGGIRTIEDSIKTYKLAAYCAGLKKEKFIVIAGLYLRIAWLYRLIKNKDQEFRFLKIAIANYNESYSRDDFKGTQVSEVRILYLLGELSRRVDDIEKAVKFFSMVIERQNRSVETTLVEMARDRWHDIRESQKKAN
jgi:uncharacterized protein